MAQNLSHRWEWSPSNPSPHNTEILVRTIARESYPPTLPYQFVCNKRALGQFIRFYVTGPGNKSKVYHSIVWSHTGCIIFLNSAPILWYTKRQATIESSTFGSEAVALRTLLGLVKDLRYKLRMLGVPLVGPAVVFGDNKSVINGASIPEAKLSKKHLGICYHAIREASAAGVCRRLEGRLVARHR